MSQNMMVTCLRSPSIWFRLDKIFSVRPAGRYRWITSSFSSKENLIRGALVGDASLWPHSPQNLSPTRMLPLHCGQAKKSSAPHSRQYFFPSGFSYRHFEHFMIDALRPEKRPIQQIKERIFGPIIDEV
jgi:hypothetical protein